MKTCQMQMNELIYAGNAVKGKRTSEIYHDTTGSEIRDFDDPNFDGAYYQNPTTGELVLKLQGTQSLPGNPNVFQHEAQGRFDLVFAFVER